jgi:hypothetical protein
MKEWRFVGFDDSFKDNRCYIVGCITASTYIEGFMVDSIEVDGMDVTHKIISMVRRSKFREQLKCIFLSGVTFGGFNIADISEINRRTGIPVVVVMRKMPNFEDIERALMNVGEYEERIQTMKKAGEIYSLNEVYVQLAGCSLDEARVFLKGSTLKGKLPEPLRIAHMVASAIVHGESRGRA